MNFRIKSNIRPPKALAFARASAKSCRLDAMLEKLKALRVGDVLISHWIHGIGIFT